MSHINIWFWSKIFHYTTWDFFSSLLLLLISYFCYFIIFTYHIHCACSRMQIFIWIQFQCCNKLDPWVCCPVILLEMFSLKSSNFCNSQDFVFSSPWKPEIKNIDPATHINDLLNEIIHYSQYTKVHKNLSMIHDVKRNIFIFAILYLKLYWVLDACFVYQ